MFVIGFNTGPDDQRFVTPVKDFGAGYSAGVNVIRRFSPTTWTSDKDIVFYIRGAAAPPPMPIRLTASILGFVLLMTLGLWQFRLRRRSLFRTMAD